MIVTGKVGRHGRITLPQAIRASMGLREGDMVQIRLKDDMSVEVRRIRPFLEWRGSIPVSGPQDLDAIREYVLEQHAREIALGESDDS